jgi:magnesium chelatase subunit I
LPSLPTTLGALKESPFGAPDRQRRSVKDELRQNLLARLACGGPLFPGVIGYEDTVMPQIVNALLSRHNFILLGLRGQAKSRILRSLVTLLDEAIPIVEGSEVNDHPYAPLSREARDRLAAQGARVLGSGEPSIGAHGKPVLFLHPKDFCGTLVELEQA